MAIKLHEAGVAYAKKLIQEKEIVHDEHIPYSEVVPDRDEKVRYINTHSPQEYGQWFLAVDTDKPENSIERYSIPHGDFSVVHRVILLEAQQQASKNGYHDIQHAAQELLNLMSK